MTAVKRCYGDDGLRLELLDATGAPVAIVSCFLRQLAARGCSPNTIVAYAHDLQHLWRFLTGHGLEWDKLRPSDTLGLLEHLRASPCRRRRMHRLGPALVAGTAVVATRLSPATINRVLAAVSSFYEWAILAQHFDRQNPIEKRVDPALMRVPDRHRPFLEGTGRQQPIRRTVRVRTVQRLPRPLGSEQVAALILALRCKRDHALVRLMLDGGLRPGEVLGLHLADVAYGRRRIVIRARQDHPKGARSKGRTERVVDLHEPATLEAVSLYVMAERPTEATTPFVFLVGGGGARRCEPLGYAALAKLFARACERAGIREPWMTPHVLRHTHATRMWEGGMRELALQKRLGHASPESTRVYTRVSDPAVVTEYRRALGIEEKADEPTAAARDPAP
jgi:integrase